MDNNGYKLPGGATQLYKSHDPNGTPTQTVDVSDAVCFIVLREHALPDGTEGTSVQWESRVDPDKALSLLTRVLPHVRESTVYGPNAADN